MSGAPVSQDGQPGDTVDLNHRPARVAFVVEEALGHRTHGLNLKRVLDSNPKIQPIWAPVPWETTGLAGRMPLYASNWTVRSGLRARRLLARASAVERLDALFFHTQVPSMLCLDWLRRVPSVTSLDATPRQIDALGAHYDHTPGPPFLEQAKHALHRTSLAAAAHVVAWSKWTERGLIEDYGVAPEKISVIPPGVDVEQWRRQASLATGDGTLPSGHWESRQPVRILFVGGNFARKGGHLLLSAFKALRARFGEGVQLEIVTADPVAEQPGVRVHHGMGPNSGALRRLFHEADLFCLPTLGDCMPLALAEAGAAGLPAITTRLAAIPELVQDGVTGLLVQPGDGAGLASALETLVTRPLLRRRLGLAAQRHVTQLFDVRINASRLVEVVLAVAVGAPAA